MLYLHFNFRKSLITPNNDVSSDVLLQKQIKISVFFLLFVIFCYSNDLKKIKARALRISISGDKL